MPVIKLNEQRFSLRPGSNRLGMGEVEIPVDGAGVAGAIAVIDVTPTGSFIRPGTDGGGIRVNGMLLTNPMPLLHGDKIDVAGQELRFSDDSTEGKTQYVAADEVARLAAQPSSPPLRSAPTGGRLVSLVDGKEYPVGPGGVSIGRDAGSDIVVAERQVSRKHAVVAPTQRGYEIQDLSSNGVYVNGSRVAKAQILNRSDVVRVGTEEFRFHADVVSLAPTIEFSAIADRLRDSGVDSETTDAPAEPFPLLPSLRRPEPPPRQPTPAAETPRRHEAMRRTGETRRPESVQIGRRPAGASATPSRLARATSTAERQIPPTPARSTAAASATSRPRSEGNLSWLWFVLLIGLAVSAFYLLTK
jgi:pSer/pThr/pTyr-binding forkhead associated (FHA) protein